MRRDETGRVGSLLLVLLGAAIGAPLRYLTDRAVQARHDTAFPWGTFAVNVGGSLVLGGVTAAVMTHAAPHWLRLLVGVGFCGAPATYSAFSYETLRLVLDGALFFAVVDVLISIVATVGAAFLGAAVAMALGQIG